MGNYFSSNLLVQSGYTNNTLSNDISARSVYIAELVLHPARGRGTIVANIVGLNLQRKGR